MKWMVSTLVCLLLALDGTAWAQSGPGGILTLEESIARALEQHPSMKLATAQHDQARALRKMAMADWFPSLSASGSVMRYQEPSLVAPLHGFSLTNVPSFDETLLRGTLDFRWTIFDGGARSGQVRQSRNLVEAASSGIDRARQDLIAQVVKAYLRVVAEKEILAAHDARVAVLDSQLAHARLRRDVGRAADVEVMRFESAVASASADRVKHEAALNTAMGDLVRLTGAPSSPEANSPAISAVHLRGSDQPDKANIITAAQLANPSLLAAERQRDAALASRTIARGSRWPELKAVGSYVDYGASEGDHTAEWNAGVVLSWPLFTGGAVAGSVSKADAAARAAADEVDLRELEVRAEADRAFSALDEANARVAALERAVASQTEVVRIERLSIETGAGTQTDYLAAEADLLTVQTGLIEARHAAINARVALARLTGSLNEDWVHSNLESES